MDPSNELLENLEDPMIDDNPIKTNSESKIELYQIRLPPGWVDWLNNEGNLSEVHGVLYNLVLVEGKPVILKSVTVNDVTKHILLIDVKTLQIYLYH